MRAEVFEDRAGEWRWRFVSDNGQIVGTSGEGYAQRTGAQRALDHVLEDAAILAAGKEAAT